MKGGAEKAKILVDKTLLMVPYLERYFFKRLSMIV